ncbi:uncharacterized protein [Cebidichthys violaceus]|uniref:uncharacterized protein n=1 Tax=Cebidichthys violaceus TaxID=271503 RepID=UPI0035CBD68B
MMPLCVCLVLLSQICQVPADDETSRIIQDSGVITANVGQNVTLKCFFQDNAVTFLSWYQQKLGGKPFIISTGMRNTEASIYPAYKERFRVSAQGDEGTNHLVIEDLHLSDSATYFCGSLEFNTIEFGQGAFLHVKASPSNIRTVVHQPALQQLRSGDSVNLSCTVHAGACEGEQSLYWFRHRAAQPAIIYRHADKCEYLPDDEPHKKECILNLALKSVSSTDAGRYYCALASCGEIVLGSGTKVEIVGGSTKVPLLQVYCLSAALAVFIAMLLVLAFALYKLKKKSCSVCKGAVSHPAASDVVKQDADIFYAALSLNRTSERHRHQDNVEEVCVYSRVKSRKQ